jgi:Arc/MetJ-type ribon-helix-helix transcriptional regulator
VQITIRNPELVEFLKEQVAQGRFNSPEEVVEAALLRMRSGTAFEDLNPETLATVRTSREELGRGEELDFREALGELRRRLERR